MVDFAKPALAALLVALTASATAAPTPRSPAPRRAFVATHPCPVPDQPPKRCPGHVVDHIVPLCAGGQDHPDNMQWQTTAAGKLKDRFERQLCTSIRTAKPSR